MSAASDRRRIAQILLAVGVILLVAGALRLVTAPTAQAMPSQGSSFEQFRRDSDTWFDSNAAHDRAVFMGIAGLMLGGFVTAASVLMSRRARAMAFDTVEQGAAALGRGLQRGLHPDATGRSPSERLAELEQLRAQGLISADELAEKRAAILAEL